MLAESKSDFINRIAGVYKYTSKINFYEGPNADPQYTQPELENILEIVPYNKEAVYFRIHTYFDNAHVCSLYGIANALDKTTLRYESKGSYDQCVLNIKFSGNKIVFSDPNSSCREMSCGARGGYDRDDRFQMKQKLKIRYMKLLLNSREYKEAVAKYENQGDTIENSGSKEGNLLNWSMPAFEFHN